VTAYRPCGRHSPPGCRKRTIDGRGIRRRDPTPLDSARPTHQRSCWVLKCGAGLAEGGDDGLCRLVHTHWVVDVPVQYFQSVIAIELAVTGALLWQIRFFDSRRTDHPEGKPLPDPRLRLGLALVLGATMFGSLWAMADEGPRWAALAVTVGLAVSLTPILLRVLPPLAKDAATDERDPKYGVTVVGLLLYVAVVAGFLVLLDAD
jgi:hypothetical protein